MVPDGLQRGVRSNGWKSAGHTDGLGIQEAEPGLPYEGTQVSQPVDNLVWHHQRYSYAFGTRETAHTVVATSCRERAEGKDRGYWQYIHEDPPDRADLQEQLPHPDSE